MSRKPHAVVLATSAMSLAGLLLAGCAGEGTPAAVGTNATSGASAAAPAGPRARSSSPAAASAGQADAGPLIPADARYTIECQAFHGADHVQMAKGYKDAMARATRRNEFYVVHDETGSTLYFGYYRQIEHTVDPAEAKRADDDLTFVRSIGDDQNHLYFPGALKEPLAVPDPEGPPQFDLARLDADRPEDDPARRYWTIAVAAYTPDATFGGADAGKSYRQMAVESTVELRKHGIEAYYYNGPNVSQVCIGAWPRDAIKEQDAKEAKSQSDTGQELVVANRPLPQAMRDEIKQSGRDIQVFEPKVDVDQSSTLLATWHQYAEYSVNGYVEMVKKADSKTGQQVERPKESFLVAIPRQQASLLPTVQAEPAPNPADTANPLLPASGAGRLKSVSP